MDTALPQKCPIILDRNLAKANSTENHVCTSCDKVYSPWYVHKTISDAHIVYGSITLGINEYMDLILEISYRLKIQSENGIGHEMLPQFMENGSIASSELKIDYNFTNFG